MNYFYSNQDLFYLSLYYIKEMEYRVILTQNNEFKKLIHLSNNKANAFICFRDEIYKSESVMFEKKHINNNGIIPVKYMLYVVKKYKEGDTTRFVKNNMGKLVNEELLFGEWVIMDSYEARIEENLWIYGYNPRKERKTIRDVVKVLMKGIGSEKLNKEVIVVHNKLVIYNENEFDMIICKCLKDAQRLHHLLYKTAVASKIKGLLFMGTASPVTTSLLYEIIQEETGWPMKKIHRTTTRP